MPQTTSELRRCQQRRPHGRVLLTLLLAAVAFTVTNGQALASTLSFTGGFSSDWNTAGN